jgi:predicted nucleotidyltransferase
MSARIQVDQKQIAEFCQRHHVRKLAFFGSVLRDDFRPDSDVDVLIEFEENREPGLFRLGQMTRELSDVLGHRVDLRTPEDLSQRFRDDVIASAEVEYAA